MKDTREEVKELSALGKLPSETNVDLACVEKYESLYRAIRKPITDDEARVLVKLFCSDGAFGLASSLMHLIETAPGWPIADCLRNNEKPWIIEMRNRALPEQSLSATAFETPLS